MKDKGDKDILPYFKGLKLYGNDFTEEQIEERLNARFAQFGSINVDGRDMLKSDVIKDATQEEMVHSAEGFDERERTSVVDAWNQHSDLETTSPLEKLQSWANCERNPDQMFDF